jgi:hypothetical protein
MGAKAHLLGPQVVWAPSLEEKNRTATRLSRTNPVGSIGSQDVS